MNLQALKTSVVRVRKNYPEEIDHIEGRIVGELDLLLNNLLMLAKGEHEVVTDHYLPSELVCTDVGGVRRLKYPDAEPGKMVLMGRTVVKTGPDRSALKYLINRIMGVPKYDLGSDIIEQVDTLRIETDFGAKELDDTVHTALPVPETEISDIQPL